MKDSHADAYKQAGVDVTAGYASVEKIKPLVKSTENEGVLGSIGGFGGLFMPDLTNIKEPVFVSGTDGVGTKLKLAFLLDKHDTVGIDCVAMCVNDIICSGAIPMFFLDYIACGKNDPDRIAEIVSGIADGCRQAGCALIGGETAEMPGFYEPDEYDLAGFSVGLVDKPEIFDTENVKEGDLLIGLDSSGVHSNGFSLVRKLFDVENTDLTSPRDDLDGKSLGEVLIEPTKIYVPAIKLLIENGIKPHGISHITGGGFYENIPRMLPEGLTASIDLSTIPKQPIFELIQETGELSDREMYNTFNMGIGMVLAVDKNNADKILELFDENGIDAQLIGKVVTGERGVELN